MDHNGRLNEDFERLVFKFTELLTGEATAERVEMVKVWSLYSHMLKVMPSLVKHWTADENHKEAKQSIRFIFEEIQRLNEENKAKIREHQSNHLNKGND